MLRKYGHHWDSGFWKLRFPIPENFGQGSEQPDPVEGVPAD